MVTNFEESKILSVLSFSSRVNIFGYKKQTWSLNYSKQTIQLRKFTFQINNYLKNHATPNF